MRRVVAQTSRGAFEHLRKRDTEIRAIRDRLKASSTEEIPGKLDRLATTERELRKQIEQFNAKSAGGEVEALLGSAPEVQGTRIVSALIEADAQGIKKLRDLVDRIKQKAPRRDV